MSLHKNRVKMTSATTGTGTLTLGSASSGYQSFATAYGADATVDILITEGTAWEVARDCAYTNSGTTVSRGTLEASSTGSAVSFGGTQVVSVIATAAKGTRIEDALLSVTPGGRLTLESGVPVSTTDQTAKTSVYYTPYVHNIVNLWDGTNWVPTTFTEKTLALGTLTSGKPYDVFGYLSSGALVLESLVWTDDTTRATAVTLQDGRYCKSGDKTRLLLGTFYTTDTTTTEDSQNNRYLANAYNTVNRLCVGTSTANHTYTTASNREWNNGTSNTRGRFICPVAGAAILIGFDVAMQRSSGIAGYLAMGLNSTTAVLSASYLMGNALANFRSAGAAGGQAVAGLNYFTCIEYGETGVSYESWKGVAACLL